MKRDKQRRDSHIVVFYDNNPRDTPTSHKEQKVSWALGYLLVS